MSVFLPAREEGPRRVPWSLARASCPLLCLCDETGWTAQRAATVAPRMMLGVKIVRKFKAFERLTAAARAAPSALSALEPQGARLEAKKLTGHTCTACSSMRA